MSEQEDNLFGGFGLLDKNSLAVPEKKKKEPKKEIKDKTEDKTPVENTDDKTEDDIFEKAKKEADEALALKNKKPVVSEEDTEDVENEDIADEDSEEDEPEADDSSSFKAFASFLKEEGMADFDDESFNDSEEGLKEVWKNSLIKEHEAWKQSYPEDAQQFLDFIDNGGDPKDFHKYYYQEASFEDFTVDTEENQKYAIREGLKLAGWEDEAEIEDEISLYEDAGKLEAKAKAHLTRLQKVDKENKKLLVEAQKRFAQEQEEKKKQEFEEFKKGLFDREEISGFKFSKKMKDELWDYMVKPIDKKTGETQYQKDSQSKGAEARYMFAYLLKNNWNVESLSTNVKNKVVSGIKKKLSNYSDSRGKMKTGTPAKQNVDGDENSFAGFKNFIKS